MANRSYPPFGRVKTIVLPVPDTTNGITYQEYKDMFGIDLKDFLSFDKVNGRISLKPLENTFLLFNITALRDMGYIDFPTLVPVGSLFPEMKQYSSGVNGGSLTYSIFEYVTEDDGLSSRAYISFSVSKDLDFSIENLIIGKGEY